MWKYILVGVLAIGILSAGVRAATLALFSDVQAVSGNTFTTGTLNLDGSTTTAIFSVSGMAPGDVSVSPLIVTNGGSLAMRYAMEYQATDGTPSGLIAQLKLRVAKQVGGSCDATTAYWTAAGGSVVLTNDTELSPAILVTEFPASATALIGNQTAGPQTGDRDLGVSGTETLCFAVVFPSAATSPQGSTGTSATFTVYAEQTANNMTP